MPIETINLGTYPNSGQGDDLRTAFTKVNNNFAFLDATSAVTADNIGTGARVFKEKIGDNLQLRTVNASTGITVTENSEVITIGSVIDITRDTAPALGGTLDLNNFNITGTGNIAVTGDLTVDEIYSNLTNAGIYNSNVDTITLGNNASNITLGKSNSLTTALGDVRVQEDLTVAGGRIYTEATSAYLFNTTANYVYIGGNAVRIDMGNVNSIVELGNDLQVNGDLTVDGIINGQIQGNQSGITGLGNLEYLTVTTSANINNLTSSGTINSNTLNVTNPINGNLSGTATAANTVYITDSPTSNQTYFVTLVDGYNGTKSVVTDSNNLSYVPQTNTLTTGNIVAASGTFTNIYGLLNGNVTGNAGTVTNGVYTNSSINELADVDTLSTPPTNNQALVWNNTQSKWIPGTVTGAISILDEGSSVSSNTTIINFIGAGVTASGSGSVTVTIPGGGGGGAGLDFGSFISPAGFTLDLGTF